MAWTINKDRLLGISTMRRNWREPFSHFARSEAGVVSVEWVALASALVVGAVIIGVIVMNSLVAPAQNIGNQLTVTTE